MISCKNNARGENCRGDTCVALRELGETSLAPATSYDPLSTRISRTAPRPDVSFAVADRVSCVHAHPDSAVAVAVQRQARTDQHRPRRDWRSQSTWLVDRRALGHARSDTHELLGHRQYRGDLSGRSTGCAARALRGV